MYCMIHIQKCVYYLTFRHIRAYSRPIKTFQPYCHMPYLEHCVTLAYYEPCHIQNPDVFKPKIYSELCQGIFWQRRVTLAYWEPCHIQNFAMFRSLAYLEPEAYSESCLYRHIQAYSAIFDNDSYNNINFLFFHFNFTLFNEI